MPGSCRLAPIDRLPPLALLAVAAILAGCNQGGRPPADAPGAIAPAALQQAGADGGYVVVPGDTVAVVAERLGVGVAELIRLNGLTAPYELRPGQRLMVPGRAAGLPPQLYTVQPGDTLYLVAQRFTVPIRSLIDANRLVPPYEIAPGSKLLIPPQNLHVVQPGDTVYGISRRYGIDRSSLVRLNGIAPPYTIYVGQRLVLPAGAPSEPPTLAQLAAAQQQEATGAGQPGGSGVIEAVELPAPTAPAAEPPVAPAPSGTQTAAIPPLPPPLPEIAPAEALEPVPAAVPQAPPLSGGRFLWPVNGRVISGYGPKTGGLHNDGINIAAPRGTPVRAAESGVVVYAGNELRGFGNMLLIRHADGWVSAYAHNDSLLVQRGDKVTRGQTIARVGSSGNVDTPQLHFELRQGTRAVDPLTLLGPQGA